VTMRDPVTGRVYKAREYGPNGVPIRDIDFTCPRFRVGSRARTTLSRATSVDACGSDESEGWLYSRPWATALMVTSGGEYK
jgi:hypothetical protein